MVCGLDHSGSQPFKYLAMGQEQRQLLVNHNKIVPSLSRHRAHLIEREVGKILLPAIQYLLPTKHHVECTCVHYCSHSTVYTHCTKKTMVKNLVAILFGRKNHNGAMQTSQRSLDSATLSLLYTSHQHGIHYTLNVYFVKHSVKCLSIHVYIYLVEHSLCL